METTMDKLIAMLRDEERKLAGRLTGLRAAIQALSGNSSSKPNAGDRGSKLRGKKLSAAHRRAIKEGIRKSRMLRKAGTNKK
jgi:hypothetical protein